MTREELLDAIGDISNETVAKNAFAIEEEKPESESVKGNTYVIKWMQKNRRLIAGIASAAAILLIISAGGLLHDQTVLQRKTMNADDTAAAEAAPQMDAMEMGAAPVAAEQADEIFEEAEEEAEIAMDFAEDDAVYTGDLKSSDATLASGEAVSGDADWGEYVNVYGMIPVGNAEDKEESQRIAEVKVGSYTAQYECIQGADENMMRNSLGREVEGNEGWYRVSGHAELRFLIHVSGEEYTLWRFTYFLAAAYPYRDVLTMIYNVHSSDEIDAIVSSASNTDNTAEGQKLQEEIGLLYITDASDLKKLYDILCGITCYGGNHWEMIDYGQNDDVMLYSVRMGRDLDVFLKRHEDGGTADVADMGFGLKYTAVSGMFYEYGGVAYNRLSTKDCETVNRILGIETGED